jgi:hypothetical protein
MSPSGAPLADDGVLTPRAADSVVFMWDFAKFKRDFFLSGDERMDEPSLIGLAADEQQHVVMLEAMLDAYRVDRPIYYWGNLSWDFWEAAREIGLSEYLMWPNSNYVRPAFFEAGGFIVETHIQELRQALAVADEQPLIDAYTVMLADAFSQLRYFASQLFDDPLEYAAQLLTQDDVDAILSGTLMPPGFVINAGLNDAWFDPATEGQGFFISVYEQQGLVFLSWLTYDTELPDPEVSAKLGNTCQRWLTALGEYEGDQAELVVYSSGGGVFDKPQPAPEAKPVGSIVLQFTDCDRGSVVYELPGIRKAGAIPIQRLLPDNTATCEAKAYPAR